MISGSKYLDPLEYQGLLTISERETNSVKDLEVGIPKASINSCARNSRTLDLKTAVLRSSVREFLAQELMDALGIPTSRSLTLFVSRSEIVRRPWYSKGSRYFEPDIMIDNQAAITTRVAPSFLRARKKDGATLVVIAA